MSLLALQSFFSCLHIKNRKKRKYIKQPFASFYGQLILVPVQEEGNGEVIDSFSAVEIRTLVQW